MNDKEMQLKRDNFIADLRQQMSTPSGRRVIWWILKLALYNSPIMETSSVVYRSAAKQELAFNIADQLKKACIDEFHLMEKENTKREA